jgi:hypothetical protein
MRKACRRGTVTENAALATMATWQRLALADQNFQL